MTAARSRIDIDRGAELGLAGLVRRLEVLAQGRDVLGYLDRLTPTEARTVGNDAHNMRDAAENGLRLLADLLCGYDEAGHGPLAPYRISWLVDFLTDVIEQSSNLEHIARGRLLRCGYDEHGEPIDPSTWSREEA